MKLKQTTIIFVAGAAFAAWLSAAIAPGRPVMPVGAVAPAPADAGGAALAGEIARLRGRLRPEPGPVAPTRNPFMFQSTRRAAAGTAVPRDRGPAVTAYSVTPPLPRLALSGIAEDPSPDGGGPIRTAIITANDQLFLAKEGDTVAAGDVEGGGYRVGNISADGADLTDLRDGTVRRLLLK